MTPLSDLKTAAIRASFAQQGMMQSLAATILDLAPGRVRIAAPIRAEVSQQQGFAHAALAFALGDSAAGYAALSLMPEGADVVTVEMKINLIAPALGERLVATGDVLKAGRRITVVRAEVVAEGPGGTKTIALLQGTMMPV